MSKKMIDLQKKSPPNKPPLPSEPEVDVQAILEKYDAGSNNRKKMPAFWFWFIFTMAVTLSVFHLYTAIFGTLPSNQQRGFHLALGLGLIFLLYPARKSSANQQYFGYIITGIMLLLVALVYLQAKIALPVALAAATVLILIQWAKGYQHTYHGIPLPDLMLSGLGIAAGFYHVLFFEDIIARVGIHNDQDFLVAGVGILLVLEAARRTVGLPLVVFAGVALIYAHLGPYMPQLLAHRGLSIERIIAHQFLSMEAILGIPIAISATFIYLYLLFAVILRRTGLERFFTDASMAMVGGMTGGPAKIGVMTSALSGTITGSSVANTVSNGAFTIPMMKRAGYKPEYAAGVEAASSTGGQILPPIMGSAAFLMIEFTGIPYQQIIQAALIPAILWFVAQFFAVHYESKKMGIMGLPRDQLPNLLRLLITRGYMLLPIVAILTILLMGMSVMKAALYGIYTALATNLLAMLAAYILGKKGWIQDRLSVKVFFEILADTAKTALPVIAACAAAGIIGGIITLTGLGLKLTGIILDLTHNQLFLTMLLTMVASIILGMGLPTTANYVITATVAAPALIAFDCVPLLAAHLFVFYFGIVADITPPVALAAYAGAGIARSNPFMTSLQALKIAIGGFIIPYMIIYTPVLILQDVTFEKLTLAIIAAVLGMYCISVALAGFMERLLHPLERLLLAGAGISLIFPDVLVNALGVVVLAIVVIRQKWLKNHYEKQRTRN